MESLPRLCMAGHLCLTTAYLAGRATRLRCAKSVAQATERVQCDGRREALPRSFFFLRRRGK
jgi:hypothetical protein